ncbi:hypothetical protein [Streptomyces sp. NBC_00648]|uniref:hypothetical protein n=1 Tax=Streptomyces sp. NBC_00648 TaxID=2975797 RepID=UPI00324F148A
MDNTGARGWKPESHHRGAETAIRTVAFVAGGMLALMLLGIVAVTLLYAVALQS